MIDIQDKKDCCGCGACVQRCPKHCIAMLEDEEGFLYPQVDKSACIECGLCEKVCPVICKKQGQFLAVNAPKTYAANNPDEAERLSSSSGGLFIALAEAVLAEGGVVFGAVYDENWMVRHSFAEDMAGVRLMMGSKYLQSRIEDCFWDAEIFLKQGRTVLFTGTSCQIQGLHSFLRKEYENLLTVDVICHGVPSPGVWRRYLTEIQPQSAQRADGKNSVLSSSLNVKPTIVGISFRDKKQCGWKKYCFVVRESASKADKNTVLLSDIHYENPYMRGFLANIYLRPSCYTCYAKGGTSRSDITIADFWGAEHVCPSFDDDKGTGLLLVHTGKGKKYIERLNLFQQEVESADALRYNPSYYKSVNPHPKRAKFFKGFKRGKSVATLVYKCLAQSLYDRIVWNVKKRILGI